MFHTLAWVSKKLEIKNIKDSIGKIIFRCSQTTEIALLFTDWPAYHLFLGSHFDGNAYLVWCAARIWTLLHEALKWICRKYASTNDNTPSFCRYLSFFLRKVRVSRFTQKPFGLKNVIKKPTLDLKQKVFPLNKIKITQFRQWINGWLSKDYRILVKPEGFPNL